MVDLWGNLLTALLVCFAASFLLALFSYFLVSINAGHRELKERLAVAFKVFYRSFCCCLCPVLACCCYFFISSRKRRCLLCSKNVVYWSHNTKCKRALEEDYNKIPDSPAFQCRKCNAPLKIWPKDKLVLMPSLWCSRCEQVILNAAEQNIHICFLCDKMLCGRHIKPGPTNTIRTIVDWAFLENLTIEADYQGDLFIPQTMNTSRQTAGTQPPLHYPPAFQSSSTTVFSPTAPPSLPGDFLSRSGFDSDPSADNFLDQQGSREQEAPEADFGVVYNDLPPSYDIAMQDEDLTRISESIVRH